MCSPAHKGHDDLTSSPPSSGLSPAVSTECPAELLATEDRGAGTGASDAQGANAGTGASDAQGANAGTGTSALQEAAPVQIPADAVQYTVKKGETLYGICMERYRSMEPIGQICQWNGLADENRLSAGQELYLPAVGN